MPIIAPEAASRWCSSTRPARYRRAFGPVLDMLEARRDMIAPDLPGFGDSPPFRRMGPTVGRPWRQSPQEMLAATRNLATCPGFEPEVRDSLVADYQWTEPLGAPVIIAWGTRDRLPPPRQAAEHLGEADLGGNVASCTPWRARVDGTPPFPTARPLLRALLDDRRSKRPSATPAPGRPPAAGRA